MTEDSWIIATTSTDFARAIGLVTMTSVEVELQTAELYADLLGAPLASIVALGQSFEANRQACLALVKADAVSDQAAEGVMLVLETARNLYDKRSNVVHGYWALPIPDSTKEETRRSYRIRRWAKQDARAWTVAELEELARALSAVASRIATIRTEFGRPA